MAGNWGMFPRALCKYWGLAGIPSVGFSSFPPRASPISWQCQNSLSSSNCTLPWSKMWFREGSGTQSNIGRQSHGPGGEGYTRCSHLSLCQRTGSASLWVNEVPGGKSSWTLHALCGLGQLTPRLWDHRVRDEEMKRTCICQVLWGVHEAMWNRRTWSLQRLCKG